MVVDYQACCEAGEQRRDHASRRRGKVEAIGRKLKTVEVFMEHAQNHVWRDLFGSMPFNPKAYWKAIVEYKYKQNYKTKKVQRWIT